MPTSEGIKEKVLVIGSGIGGLSTGIILSKLGFDVTVIEKNRQPGGMMRSYARRGVQCNVGLHYMGALDHGQILRRCFDFLDITEQSRWGRFLTKSAVLRGCGRSSACRRS